MVSTLQKLAPEYGKAAEEIAKHEELKDKVKLADFNCEEGKELCSAQQIPGFPSMKLFKNGMFYKDFEEGRQAEDIVNWLQRKCGPAFKEYESEDALKAFAKDQAEHDVTTIMGIFKTKDSELYQNFVKATALEDFAFGAYINDAVKEDEIIVHRYWNNEKLAYTTVKDEKELMENIANNGYPLVDEVSGKTFKRFADTGLPIAVLFIEYEDQALKAKQIELLTKAATALKGKMVFGYSNGEEYGQQLEMMGGNAAKLPGLAAMDIETRHNYPYPADKELTEEDIVAWATGVVDGSIAPYLRSAPVPENPVGEDGVTVVVGKTFDDIVMDPTKDVLVEFYAPWCGHCKKLAPIYSKVATYFESIDNLVIAKVDATENDITAVNVQGFPTLFFFPSSNKAAPITFSGDRNAKGLKTFIAKHAQASKQNIISLVKAKKAEKKAKQAEDL
eukprot:CAMPEP_0117420892 /NCGR_PEP_ID=MMETSP0758-20121206/2129_1 /TAXON_ID=63605 /ORGANISM="Percolomonas cosmopolitus, Strain AE-1 (ATCC 50343)" /LENGTH=446 /DNA_ID=CAMNT_0005202761 /DNA_START=172 /DNA_END=1513 /DNA_ORIENTATION=-